MGYILFFIVTFVILVVGAIVASNASNKARREKMDSLVSSIPNFTPSNIISDYENRFRVLIDDTSKKVCIISDETTHVVDYEQIMSVEYIENGNTISSKSTIRTIGGAIVGGALAGGAGAIVGGLSGDSRSITKIRSIIVKIMIRDINSPSIEILAFDCRWTPERKPIKPDDILCRAHADAAKEVVNVLSVIIDEVDRKGTTQPQIQPQISKQETLSIADEIKKLANLRDEGILTQEEFEKKKASLLS